MLSAYKALSGSCLNQPGRMAGMNLTTIPTEQTTALTDAALALLALAGAGYIRRLRWRDSWKSGIWFWVMIALATAAGLGAVAHGLVLPEAVNGGLWSGIYFALGLCVACFLAGAVYDLRGHRAALKALYPALAAALLAFTAAKLNNDSFVPFVVFEGVAMTTALVIYGYLALFTTRTGMKAMALGVTLTLLAALSQGLGWGSFHVIWQFNHNGTYHLIQMLGLAAIVWGLRAAFLARRGQGDIQQGRS